ncbi:alpha-galactosidase [Streptomyces sp. NPDC048419]|uniref:alpha-galactosidase n=1 Tax=Streptomyces sp. NPDC048419 TaxID=3365547 RepID=UPI003723B7E6
MGPTFLRLLMEAPGVAELLSSDFWRHVAAMATVRAMGFNVTPGFDVPPPSVPVLQLRAAGVGLLLDLRGRKLPRVVHWGADLGWLSEDDLVAVADAGAMACEPRPVGLLPGHFDGWPGRTGLSGYRPGRDGPTEFKVVTVHHQHHVGGGGVVEVTACDEAAQLALRLEMQMTPAGLLRTRAAVRNAAVQTPYTLRGLCLALPVPPEATELLDLAARWGRGRVPQRMPFGVGARGRESRRGRTGADASILFAAGAAGFGFRSGEVWALHLGWSGNHRVYAERISSGEAVIAAGELLLGDEVSLAAGEEYISPWLYASYGRGLDEVSERFHRFQRSQRGTPRPRPVVLNTWEAMCFDQDLDRLKELADVGAEVGVERFVLGDGWCRHRRDDHVGLGDWYVDEKVWPNGLHPLIEHVHARDMDFGVWVGPEMVNPDSDLARSHPDWILRTGGRMPPSSRHQQVLDLANPAAYSYILERLDALLTEYPIAFLKWDHNRDLAEADSGPPGIATVNRQTRAVYRLLAELRSRYPALEIESCSSGGTRVDLGILEHTDRIWASDRIDALERQQIQRWTATLLPPELIGSHVGAPRAHITGPRHDLSLRAGTALFGHFGIEWDISRTSPNERAELASWVGLYKEYRELLHTGEMVRCDHPDPSLWVHGVVSVTQHAALFAVVMMQTALTSPPVRIRLPGLDPQTHYRVERVGSDAGAAHRGRAAIKLTGRALAEVGLGMPSQHPDHLELLRITALARPTSEAVAFRK